MADENSDGSEKRRHPVPIYGAHYQWWTDAVERQLAVKGMNQKALASTLEIDEGALSKCIRRQKPLYEILIAVSDYLGVAYPVVLPESEAQAIEIAKAKRLHKRDSEAHEIKAGVAENANESQPRRVVSEHAVRSRKERPAKRAGKRNQPRAT